MKAVQISGTEKTDIIELDKPELSPDQVLLKVEYIGLCGSDLNTFRGLNPLAKLPVIPGHEIGAIIEETGSSVPKHIVKGLKTTVNPYTSCGICLACSNQRFNACEFNETMGVQRDGAMREYIAVPWQKLIIKDSLSTRDLALVEPMSVGFHAVDRGTVTDSDTVLVMGCGMIGIGAIVRSALRGAKVIVLDIDDQKLALAKELGAHHVINSSKEDLHESLLKYTNNKGPSVIIEAVGSAITYRAAIEEIGFTGRIVFIGYAKNDIELDTKLIVKKELNIMGSRNATASDFEAVIKLVSQGNLPLEKIVTSTYDVNQVQDAFDAWHANPGKTIKTLVKI